MIRQMAGATAVFVSLLAQPSWGSDVEPFADRRPAGRRLVERDDDHGPECGGGGAGERSENRGRRAGGRRYGA